MNVKIHKRPKPLTADDHTRIESHMFTVEFIQSLVARHQAEISRIVVEEQKKVAPDFFWIDELESEADRLFALRRQVCDHPEEADKILAELKAYKIPKLSLVS